MMSCSCPAHKLCGTFVHIHVALLLACVTSFSMSTTKELLDATASMKTEHAKLLAENSALKEEVKAARGEALAAASKAREETNRYVAACAVSEQEKARRGRADAEVAYLRTALAEKERESGKAAAEASARDEAHAQSAAALQRQVAILSGQLTLFSAPSVTAEHSAGSLDALRKALQALAALTSAPTSASASAAAAAALHAPSASTAPTENASVEAMEPLTAAASTTATDAGLRALFERLEEASVAALGSEAALILLRNTLAMTSAPAMEVLSTSWTSDSEGVQARGEPRLQDFLKGMRIASAAVESEGAAAWLARGAPLPALPLALTSPRDAVTGMGAADSPPTILGRLFQRFFSRQWKFNEALAAYEAETASIAGGSGTGGGGSAKS